MDEGGCGPGWLSVTRPVRWRAPGRARSCCEPSTPPTAYQQPAPPWTAFYRWAAGAEVAELSRLARTVKAWEVEVLAWHATGAVRTGPPRPSTCSSKRSSGSGTASATSPNTLSGCCCIAVSGGRRTAPQNGEVAHHVSWRRAQFRTGAKAGARGMQPIRAYPLVSDEAPGQGEPGGTGYRLVWLNVP